MIGAGMAGLTASLRLAESGRWHPLVVEREARAGGLARSLSFDDVTTDLGPHRIFTENPQVRELIARVAEPSLFTVERRSHIFLKGRFLPYPPNPLAMAGRLGPGAMARFGLSYLREQARHAPPRHEETYESLMRRAFGKALYDDLLRPFSAKTWKTDPAELHADTARVRVSAGSLGKMFGNLLPIKTRRTDPTSLKTFQYVRGGIETLANHLSQAAREAGAEVRLGREVSHLELDATGRVAAAHTRNEDKPINGAVFLSTVPLPRLLESIRPEQPALANARKAADGLTYLGIIFVCVVVKRSLLRQDNWLYFPEPHLVFNRAYEAKNMDRSLAPGDRTVLCIEITHRPGDAIEREHDEHLAEHVIEQMAGTGLFGRNEVAERHVYRLPYAYPLYTLDYAERLDTALDGLRGIPNLLTLGRQGLFNHNNMDHSMAMGLRAAEMVLATNGNENTAARWYDQATEFRSIRIID